MIIGMGHGSNLKESIIVALATNPVLLLFIVCGLGYALGRVKIGRSGVTLGTASVLFVGLAVGAVDQRLHLPSIVNTLGLVLFMYSVGLSSATGFFGSLNRKGLRDVAIVVFPLLLGAMITVVAANVIGQRGGPGAAMFTGSMSNSSGLAAVLDSAKQFGATSDQLGRTTVSYSITYITSMLGPMLIIVFFQRLFKVDFLAEAKTMPEYERSMQELTTCSIRVTKPEATKLTVNDVSKVNGQIAVVFGRIVRDDAALIATAHLKFKLGDIAVVVGTDAQIQRVTETLGEQLPEEIEHEQTELELRRIFVSNSDIVGIPLEKLELPSKLGVKITRIRRGDTEFIPNGETRLELGDRIRVFSQRNELPEIRSYFGDSFTSLSEVDFLALGLGVTAGLLLGLIPIPLPGGLTLRLGFAGGPLIAGILLGKLNRTGPVIWTLPFSASLTLRQFGLLLFAAAIGTQAGHEVVNTDP